MYGTILNLRDEPLSEIMTRKGIVEITNPKILINKNNFRLELYSDKIFLKSYRASFGKNSERFKLSGNDNVTPSGEYRICKIDSTHKFYKFFQLDYPNSKDAYESYRRGYINKDELDAILISKKNKECSPPETRLGAQVGIHGIGEYNLIFKNLPFTFNWTNGSIALSNEGIDELYSVLKIGTPVIISY
jgi:murein L,D-transpeptidase YafK